MKSMTIGLLAVLVLALALPTPAGEVGKKVTLTGYIGFVVAVLIALNAARINLAGLAIVGGALALVLALEDREEPAFVPVETPQARSASMSASAVPPV